MNFLTQQFWTDRVKLAWAFHEGLSTATVQGQSVVCHLVSAFHSYQVLLCTWSVLHAYTLVCVMYEWHYFTLGADNFIHVSHPAGNPESFLSPCWQSYLRELGEALQGRVRQCSCVHYVRNNFIEWLSQEGSAYLVICKCSSTIEQTSNRIWII